MPIQWPMRSEVKSFKFSDRSCVSSSTDEPSTIYSTSPTSRLLSHFSESSSRPCARHLLQIQPLCRKEVRKVRHRERWRQGTVHTCHYSAARSSPSRASQQFRRRSYMNPFVFAVIQDDMIMPSFLQTWISCSHLIAAISA